MKEEILYKKIAEILDVKSVKDDDMFNKFELWDSLAVFSIISIIEEDYKLNLTAEEIRGAMNIGGIVKLIKSKNR
jgi:acyl carrier protein